VCCVYCGIFRERHRTERRKAAIFISNWSDNNHGVIIKFIWREGTNYCTPSRFYVQLRWQFNLVKVFFRWYWHLLLFSIEKNREFIFVIIVMWWKFYLKFIHVKFLLAKCGFKKENSERFYCFLCFPNWQFPLAKLEISFLLPRSHFAAFFFIPLRYFFHFYILTL
jgi:hypothetical protein